MRKPKYNNTYVELKTDAFSIGSAPITIWAHGNFKYFEIQPARRYKDIHRDMIEATSIYFHLVDILEPVLLNKTDLPLEQVLFQVSNSKQVCGEPRLIRTVRICQWWRTEPR